MLACVKVTIDGVAASGKSSVASGVARALKIPYLSSGLLYRAATWQATQRGLDLTAPGWEAPLLAALETADLRLEPLGSGNRLWADGRDVTDELHTDAIDAGVSAVAQLPGVRAWVDAQLRRMPPPFVAEGRDMGTAVFPEADYKFYLTASAQVRAERRVRERGQDVAAIRQALEERDRRDAAQSAPAPDAVTVDTGSGPLDEIIARVLGTLHAARS